MTTADESLARHGLVPRDEALPEIRALLEAELAIERAGGVREDDLSLLCCVQLFSRGLAEDVRRIWTAKRTSMDLGVSIDVQLLCGAGVEATRKMLAEVGDPWAREALDYLSRCEQGGDFDGFTPETWLDGYRRYFGRG